MGVKLERLSKGGSPEASQKQIVSKTPPPAEGAFWKQLSSTIPTSLVTYVKRGEGLLYVRMLALLHGVAQHVPIPVTRAWPQTA